MIKKIFKGTLTIRVVELNSCNVRLNFSFYNPKGKLIADHIWPRLELPMFEDDVIAIGDIRLPFTLVPITNTQTDEIDNA